MDNNTRLSKKADKTFNDCPGAWFGCMPHYRGSDTTTGSITVNVKATVYAIAYLKRHYKIIGTIASEYKDGIVIQIADK